MQYDLECHPVEAWAQDGSMAAESGSLGYTMAKAYSMESVDSAI